MPPAERLPGDTPSPEGLAAYTALLHSCWDQEPGKRPTFPQIVFDLRCVPLVCCQWLSSVGGFPVDGLQQPPILLLRAVHSLAGRNHLQGPC